MWFGNALFYAVWSSFATLIVKKISRDINPLILTFILLLVSVPAVFVLLFFAGGIPNVTAIFYWFMLISALLDSIAFVASFYAVKMTDISLLAPISSFGPIFTTFIAIYALNEVPSQFKLFGILLVVLGSYLLNLKDVKRGILVPFRSLFSNKGVLLFLLSNFLWAITPILQKKAIFETHPQVPLYASFMGMFFASIILAPFAIKKGLKQVRIQKTKSYLWLFLIFALGTAFSQLAAYTAFSQANVSYVTTVMRMAGIFTILWGGIFLKEQNIKERLLGAGVMMLGAIVLAS